MNSAQCHIVVMLDKLVRLSFNNDPVPGDRRAKQKCLLPITLQGLPKDTLKASLCHDPDICILMTGTNISNCLCKAQSDLKSEEVDSYLITLRPNEESAWEKFTKLSTWGSPDMWRFLDTSPLKEIVQSAISHVHSGDQLESVESDEILLLPHQNDDGSEESQTDFQTLLQDHETKYSAQLTAADTDDDLSGSEIACEDTDLSEELGVGFLGDSVSAFELSGAIANMQIEEESVELLSKAEICMLLNTFGVEKYDIGDLLTLQPPPCSRQR